MTLAGRIEGSAPYGWFGEHPTLRSHLAHTMQRLGGAGFETKRDTADLVALETYLRGMKPPTTASPADPAAVAAGAALFHDSATGCGACHAAGGSDGRRHDVGSGTFEEASLTFDTPSLALVAASAPYFHDGRYATLDALLSSSDGKMGHTLHLSREDVVALRTYLETL